MTTQEFIYQPEVGGLRSTANNDALVMSNGLVYGDQGTPSMDEMRSILHTLEEPHLLEHLLHRYSQDGREHIAEVLRALPDHDRTQVLHYIINEPELEYAHIQELLQGIPQSAVSEPLFEFAAQMLELYPDSQDQLANIIDAKTVKALQQYLSVEADHNNAENILRVSDTVRSLAKILLYNGTAAVNEIRADHIIPALAKIRGYERKELLFSQPDVPLPTIGTEVESGYRHHAALAIIGGLRMPLYKEVSGTDLWEVANGYSYSHNTQAALLHELLNAGFYPTDGSLKVHKRHPISMHINLGTNGGLTAEMLQKHSHTMYLLNDALTLAHVSPERLDKRKTRMAMSIDTAKSSRKTEKSHPGECVRVEMRVNEYVGPQSESLLRQAQYMSAAAFAHVRAVECLPISMKEQGLAMVWNEFTNTVGSVPQVPLGSNIFDGSPQYALSLVEEGTVPRALRQFAQLFTEEAEKIVWS